MADISGKESRCLDEEGEEESSEASSDRAKKLGIDWIVRPLQGESGILLFRGREKSLTRNKMNIKGLGAVIPVGTQRGNGSARDN